MVAGFPTTPSEPDALRGLAYVDHLALTVSDLQEAVSFFHTVLGAVCSHIDPKGGAPWRSMYEA